MNKVIITKNTVCIEIEGWDKIWAFKGSLTIPKDSISRVFKHDGKLKPPFWRCPGTFIPKVIIAGTYYGRGRKEFWSTHFKGTIVFDLKNMEYTRIVVDVADPRKVLSELEYDAPQSGCAESGGGVAVQRRNNEAMKQPDIVRREGFLVMGTVTHRKPGVDRPEIFAAIWNDFETHQPSIEAHSVDSKYYGVSFAAGPDGNFDYMAGMAVGPVAETPEGLEIRKVPSATYAVFACPVQAIGQTYGYIFGEWRSASGYRPDTAKPAFEQYPPATDTNAPVLIHIPIQEDQNK